MMEILWIDYFPADECVNEDGYCTCLKCGRCGRIFDDHGFMIDEGGTHVSDQPEEPED